MKPLAIISTDWHITSENVGLSIDLMTQQIRLAKEQGVTRLICLGDVFEAQRAQPESALNCFHAILNMIAQAGMTLTCIAGNHDKTNRGSWDSFLRPFSNHPALRLIETYDWMKIDEKGETGFLFLSYIKEDLWVEKLNECLRLIAPNKIKHLYLFSHQCMNGSVNNDGTRVESGINAGLLRPFEACFFGHYHDEQQPIPNAYHLASWKQKNFGENADKGFYVLGLNDEGIMETEFHKSEFPEYVTVEMKASEIDGRAVLELTDDRDKSDLTHIRLKISGTADELKSLPTNKLAQAGIKVKTVDLTEKANSEAVESIKDYSETKVLDEAFKEFCEARGYDLEEGFKYLKIAI